MAGIPGLGTVVATQESPTPLIFHFVISEESARVTAETGTFVQATIDDELVLGVIQSLRRSNRYYSSPDIIHGSSQGSSVPSIYPADRWDYLIAKVRVLGSFRNKLQQRSTRPVLPGSQVFLVDTAILEKFLGLSKIGLSIGQVRQSPIEASVDLDRLLKKHLAILSISGGGKSYATSVIIEELLRRHPSQGRPALILFDVHGEYRHLSSLNKHPDFREIDVQRISAQQLAMSVSYLKAGDFSRFFPSMSYAQQRELSVVLSQLQNQNKGLTVESIIDAVYNREMNQLVKDALLGWLGQLRSSYLFGNAEFPSVSEDLEPGKLIIIDMSEFTSLWKKRIILHYFLSRIFELRRIKEIPPVVSFIEEAHQFAPEQETSSAKSIIHTIAREGRKFLCSLVLISQRPVNLSTTALSQCNSHLILRILNPHDLTYIGKTSEGINSDTLGMLTSLGVGEGLLVGEAVNYPVFIQIRRKLVNAEFDEVSLGSESRKYEKLVQ
ncbi:MAG: ATP-binding protein [Candidatus Kariarchaeaceae archaeon]|jgi:DNA helicase HerA-like ATPase